MNFVLIAWAMMMVPAAAFAQGQFLFRNYAPPEIDVRIKWGIEPPGFSIVGPGWRVEFLAGPTGTPIGALQRLDAFTDFTTNSASLWGYVNPSAVTVPFSAPGRLVDVLLVLTGPMGWGMQLGPFTVTLGGGDLPVPDLLSGVSSLNLCLDCQCDRPVVGLHRLADEVLIWWSKGLLESAESPSGPWTRVTDWTNPHMESLRSGERQRFLRAKLPFAPNRIEGVEVTFSISEGTPPLAATGEYILSAFNDYYSVLPKTAGLPQGSGNYTYESTGDRSAILHLIDSIGGPSMVELEFINARSGSFTRRSGAASQSGEFTIKCLSSACYTRLCL